MKYYINTYGCQMNVHESEKMAGILEEMGYTLADSDTTADVVVFNTCAVRESAEQKIFGNIGMLKNVKAKNPNMIIAVCGCMSQQQGYPELILKKYPYVDIIFGTHNIAKLKEFLIQKQKQKHVVEVVETEDIRLRDKMNPIRTSGTNAWVNINYGCNNFCTYCIVPYVRGREISRPMQDIISEVDKLLKEGYKQITLLGQNVNSYGNDIDDPEINFANLLKKLDELPYKYRLRFMSSHPKDLSEEVVSTMANSKNICHYLHLPVQSGSNKILKAMNRKYTVEHYMSLIDMCRKHMDDIEFSSDLIVGFPGETDEDFNDTLKLIKKVKYQQLFTFIYSKRKGTVAEKMPDQVDIKIKHQRLSKLIDEQRKIASEISQKYVGKELLVLVEGIHPKKKNQLLGSTDFGKTISFEGDESLLGSFVMVKVEKANNTSLSGKVTDILEKANGKYRLPLDKIRRK